MSESSYLILGNSAAACAAVDAIRSVDDIGSITMISPENTLAYGTPLISYIIEGMTDVAHAEIRPESWYERMHIERVFGQPAKAIDPFTKTVKVKGSRRKFGYDKLLVATGSTPFVPDYEGLPSASKSQNWFTFLTLESALAVSTYLSDALAAKRQSGQASRALVVGSGLVGVKAAEGLAHLVDETCIIFRSDHLLPAVLDADGAAFFHNLMSSHGVVAMPHTSIVRVICDQDKSTVDAVELDNGTVLDVDVLIIATGMRPNSKMLVDAGARVGRGVICDKHMKTSLPDVWAAGDVTSTHDILCDTDKPLALWPNASQQGRVAGLSMAGVETSSFEGSFARNAVGFFGQMSILSAGSIKPDVDDEILVFEQQDSYAKFVTRDGKLRGFILVNRPDGAGIYTRLIEEQIALDELADDVFARPIQLMDLPKARRQAALYA